MRCYTCNHPKGYHTGPYGACVFALCSCDCYDDGRDDRDDED